ncbi:TrkH family potassium uptake protein [Motilimonas sp. 1_MG-2023]|uniref:TrkH family potassium uptake protein n=1 Tax=Motilimonas sp. 1_MG-2023 TaxID=3062672 RepID=UPI0026E434CB|nr:TrkH family potassium uptake protein [Motilimonas sp. 1_MG-2023]MDO6524856.1 TrkH family potassium uptake protein [Motilimonas sp. 1_MG-2023]
MLNYKPLFFITGLILSKLALFMYIPMLLALFTAGIGTQEFFLSIVLGHTASFLLLHFGRVQHFRLGVREMFLLTTLVWVVGSAFAALPFMLIEHISYTDAYFETMSGITTTGSTVLSGLDTMPHSVLIWRSILQWLGGIGFIVMGVAILPFLNVGGMRLFQTESSEWSDKSTPKTQQLAGQILQVYLVLTICCYFGYLASGMTQFEAINHAMTTLSTGGYSTSDSSMSHFSPAAHWNASLFMFLGGLPFLLLIHAFKKLSTKHIYRDAQILGFVKLVLVSTVLITLFLWWHNTFTFADAVRISLFNVISVITTTGFGLSDFSAWGNFSTLIFFFLMFAGACSGSTSGGIKIFRFQIAATLLKKQTQQLLHPRGVFPQNYNKRRVNDAIIRSLVAFILSYFITILVTAAILAAFGSDVVVSLTGAITAVSNVGPGLGELIGPSGNFASLPDGSKWALSVAMLMGRLEILTVTVLFFPAFWRG